MKWKIIIPVVAVVVIAGGLLIARAQPANRNAGVFGRGSVLAKVANQLQLTDEQRTQIKGILVAEKDPLVSLLTQLHTARIQLRTVIQAGNATEASVRAAAAGVAAVEADLAEQLVEVRTFLVVNICEACGVGRLVGTGNARASLPPTYEHRCPDCGHAVYCARSYPYLTTRMADGG